MKRLLVLLAVSLALAPAALGADRLPDPALTPVVAAISGVAVAQAFCGGNEYGTWGDILLTLDHQVIPNEYLDPIVCRYAHRFQAGWRPSPVCWRKPTRCSVSYLALSALVVTHESIHISGDLNEASTECKAIQRVRRTFRLLGEPANPLYVEALVRYALWWHTQETLIVDFFGQRPYYSADCRADGKLDETPGDGIWP